MKLDLFINGESLEQSDDRKLLSQIPLRDKMVSINRGKNCEREVSDM